MKPAAVLNVLVNAQTGKAAAELRKFDRTVKNTAANTKRLDKDKLDLRVGFDQHGIDAYNANLDKISRKQASMAAAKKQIGPQFNLASFNAAHRAMDKAARDSEKLVRETDKVTTNNRHLDSSFVHLAGSAGKASSSFKKLSPGLSLATRIPVLKFGAIAAAIQAVVPPVVALTSALAPLTGLLAALPGLASAAAQGVGSIALGFAGIGTAVKAAVTGQKTAVKDAAASLQAQQASAEAVRSAIRGVGDAERGLADAQRQSKDAQEELSGARRDAARQLVDLRLAVTGASLSEKEARLELTKAIQAQSEVWADESATALDARDAELAVQRARLGLKESTVESKRAQTDYNDAQKKGVKGSDQVVSAQRGIQDAHRGVLDAQRALVDATRQVRIAQRDQAESSSKAAGGVEKLNEAMSALPPSGRTFARFIISLKPKLDALRESAAAGIFPGLTKGIKAAMGNFGTVRTIISQTAAAIGKLGEAAGKKIGSDAWGRDIQTQGERNVTTVTRLGTATLSLADGFRHIMLAAGPLVSFLTKSAQQFSAVFASWAKGARESGQLEAFFQKTIATTKITVKAFWDFGRALINIGKIADRVWGQDLLKGIGNVAQKFRDWTESVRGQRTIEQYFVRWRKRWNDIGHAVGEVIGEYNRLRRAGESVSGAFTTVLTDVLAKLIPKVAAQAGQMGIAIAKGIARGFIDANPLGKVILGGYILKKLGLLAPLFAAAGTRAGAVFGLGVSAGAAEGVAGGAAAGAGAGGIIGALGTLRSKVLPFAKKAGLAGVGIALADNVLSEFSRHAAEKGPDALEALQAKTGPKTGVSKPVGDFIAGAGKITGLFGKPNFFLKDSEVAARKLLPALQDIADKSRAISPKRAEELNHQIARIPGLSKDARAGLLGIVDAAADRGNKIGGITREFSRLKSGAVLSVKDLLKETKANFNLISEAMGTKSKKGQAAIQKNFRLAVDNIIDFKRRGVISATRAGELIAQVMKTQTGKGKDALAGNMLLAQNAISHVMTKSGTITQRGLDKIRLLMVNAMKGLGLSPDSIRMSLNLKESARKGKTFPEQRGGAISHGMVVTGGKPAGDSVHALLERGEVVINRKAVQKMGGPHAVNRINQEIPRFQTGGPVGFRRGGRAERSQVAQPNFGGHPSNVSGGVAKLIGVMQGRFPGLGVTSTTDHPYLTTSGNVSDHASGHAVDLASADYGYMNKAARWVRTSGLFKQISQGIHNPNLAIANGEIQTPPGQYAGHTWTEHLDHIHLAVAGALKAAGLGGGALGGAAPKLAQLAVTGGGAMGALVEGGLGKVRAAAQRKLGRLAARAGGVGKERGRGSSFGPPPAPGIASRTEMVRWATKALHKTGHGASPDAVEKILTLAKKESGWNTHSINLWDSNAKAGNPSVGLMQVTIDKMGMHWPEDQDNPRLWDPVANMIASINYQFGRYGGLTTQSPYAKGGIVGYAGDSLGVGTIGPLRALIDRKVEGHPSSGKTSAWGVGQLVKGAAQHVFDFGTNDATGSAIRSSINRVDQITGKKPVHVMTVNGTPAGGQSAELKNKAIRSAAHGDVNLVDWAAKHKGQLDALGHGAYPERARLIAQSIRSATGAEEKAGKDGKTRRLGKPFGGPLGRVLNKTLKALRKAPKSVRTGRMKQFVQRVRKAGTVPKGLTDQLGLLSVAADVADTNAQKAGQLNVDNEDGTTTLMPFLGKDEGGWLNDRLGYLLGLRNKIIDAINLVQERREKLRKLLEGARERLERIKAAIKKVDREQDKRRKDLDELRKKPKENKTKIAALRKTIMRVEGEQKDRGQVRTGLEQIIPVVRGQVVTLGGEEGLGGFQTNLVDLQGPGGSMKKLLAAPPINQIGGTIFDTLLSLQDLATKATGTGTDSPVADSDSVELLKQLLREANLRTSVSQRQYDVLKNFDATSGAGQFMGAFAKGGVALVGERGPELAHLPSGTRVHSASDTEQMLAPNIAVHINGDVVNTPTGKDPVEVLLNDRRFKAAIGNSRLGGRAPLPGRGGGGF